jgi:hypothetical protein
MELSGFLFLDLSSCLHENVRNAAVYGNDSSFAFLIHVLVCVCHFVYWTHIGVLCHGLSLQTYSHSHCIGLAFRSHIPSESIRTDGRESVGTVVFYSTSSPFVLIPFFTNFLLFYLFTANETQKKQRSWFLHHYV